MSANINDEPVKNQWRLKEWFPELDPVALSRFQSFYDLIIRHNKTINLISPKTMPVADALHFADSILGSQIIADDSSDMTSIGDFGSGNGFPGIIFAILYPDIKVNLIDVDPRKIEFLNHAASVMSLANLKVTSSSVELLPADSFKYAMARGFANISKTILLSRKPVPKGGTLYHMKGEQWGLEITEIPTQLCSVWYPALVREYFLPSTQIKFAIIKTSKL